MNKDWLYGLLGLDLVALFVALVYLIRGELECRKRRKLYWKKRFW